jgi:hypothetical protein
MFKSSSILVIIFLLLSSHLYAQSIKRLFGTWESISSPLDDSLILTFTPTSFTQVNIDKKEKTTTVTKGTLKIVNDSVIIMSYSGNYAITSRIWYSEEGEMQFLTTEKKLDESAPELWMHFYRKKKR